MTFTGVITFQMTGVVANSGQDYVRINAPNGIVELHPAFNTTKLLMVVGTPGQVAVDTASVSPGWDMAVANVPIISVGLGQTFNPLIPPNYDVVVISNGTTSMGISVPHGNIPAAWLVGATLNTGFKRL